MLARGATSHGMRFAYCITIMATLWSQISLFYSEFAKRLAYRENIGRAYLSSRAKLYIAGEYVYQFAFAFIAKGGT